VTSQRDFPIPLRSRKLTDRKDLSRAARVFDMEIHKELAHCVRVYHEMPLAIDALEQNAGLVYECMGEAGLAGILNMGFRLAGRIVTLVEGLKAGLIN
jgi:hypothetical protein